jgi:alginate O-acetyltransferase complex protein AlgI
MPFNSIIFAIFLLIIFFIYWFVINKKLKLQNAFLVLASYIFYGWWNWKFLFLIFFSTAVDYLVGLGLRRQNDTFKRKIFLLVSLTVNLGLLGVFKYYNFFLDNFITAFSIFGLQLHMSSLQIILPVGISFYTFQTLSYTIDVYKRKLEPTKDFIAFSAFVSFFPQLVAGPIERATNLLPQFFKKRKFAYPKAVDGLKQIMWGLFKKMVIADNCAKYANMIFNNSFEYSGSTLSLGAIFFTFQIYGDFSGYSDIAIGVSRLFGFELKKNFSFPYFSRDIAEFWRKWHISLSTWFRDYVYIPLGGSRVTNFLKVRNIFIIFLVSGLWHGANWTFIFWGVLNAIYFLPLLFLKKNRTNLDVVAKDKVFPTIKEFFQMSFTFLLVVFSWIFFRAENITQAINYVFKIFSSSFFVFPEVHPKNLVILIFAFLIVEWFGRENEFAIEKIGIKWPRWIRWFAYYALIFVIFYYAGASQQFIYFQF